MDDKFDLEVNTITRATLLAVEAWCDELRSAEGGFPVVEIEMVSGSFISAVDLRVEELFPVLLMGLNGPVELDSKKIRAIRCRFYTDDK